LLKLFNSSNPFTLFLFLVYSVAIHFHLFLNPGQFSSTYALAFDKIFMQLLHLHELPVLWLVVIHIAIVSLQGILISFLVQSNKILQKPSLVPAVVFVLITNIFHDIPAFSPEIISALIFTWALFKIFSTYNKTKIDSLLFDIGLIVAVSTLLFYPAAVFIGYAIAAVIRLRATSFREFLVLISGIAVICFLTATALFWFDILPVATAQLYIPTRLPDMKPIFSPVHIAEFSILGIVLMMALWFTGERFSSNIVQTRKYIGSFISLLLVACTVPLFSEHPAISNCYFLFIPASVIISYYLVQTKNQLYAELIFMSMLVAAIIFQTVNFA